MRRITVWMQLGAAFSLANLFVIMSWKALIYPVNNFYFDAEPSSLYAHLSVLVVAMLLTLVAFALIRIPNSRHVKLNRISHLGFLVFGIAAFGPLNYEVFNWLSPERSKFLSLPVPALVLLICVAFSARESFRMDAIARNLTLVLLFLLPFSGYLTLASARLQLFPEANVYEPRSVQEEIPDQHRSPLKKKVVWIVFDELDLAVLNNAKHAKADVSEIERLMGESLVAKNAFPPNYRTQESIPALLTGRPIRKSDPIFADDLLLDPSDGTEPFRFSYGEDIFTDLRNRGGNGGVVGWYHPYPRVFREKVLKAYWSSAVMEPCTGFSGFTTCVHRVFQRSLFPVPFITKLYASLPGANEEIWGETRDTQFERNTYLLKWANELVADPRLDLVFLHFSAPHFPFIARTDLQGGENCYTALEVVNDNIKQIRSILEDTGQWDDTVLIVSSDHWWRHKRPSDFHFLGEEEQKAATEDIRIPFFIRFPGQKLRIDYEQSINTVITRQLILDIFDEKIRESDELPSWIDHLRDTRPDLVNAKTVKQK